MVCAILCCGVAALWRCGVAALRREIGCTTILMEQSHTLPRHTHFRNTQFNIHTYKHTYVRRWFHAAATVSHAGTGTLYVDGVVVGTQRFDMGSREPQLSTGLHVGRYPDAQYAFTNGNVSALALLHGTCACVCTCVCVCVVVVTHNV